MGSGQRAADVERVEEISKVCPHYYVEMEPDKIISTLARNRK